MVSLIVSYDTIMKPPYSITIPILQLIASISEKLGQINAAHLTQPKAELRKASRIKTIQSSLEIEGNTLNLEQVTAILDNKKIIAPQKDILEVKNAIKLYETLDLLKAHSLTSFLQAHRILMDRLVDSAGKLRNKNVGIAKGSKIAHLAPPANMLKALMTDLFDYVKKSNDPLLIKSCVFHYELEFIHPFEDGNGRMGRLWQTVLLKQHNPVFGFLPVETLIKKQQADYYKALNRSDKAGESTPFIQFMLGIVDAALEELLQTQSVTLQATDRIAYFQLLVGQETFTRQDYLRKFKNISPATASRDLREATDKK
ncbi:MAG: cell filamentation protein Fic, partial [Sediminibacterium sp.]|nr:cell filamentation protein Fic [Sediminibacterium sp.]